MQFSRPDTGLGGFPLSDDWNVVYGVSSQSKVFKGQLVFNGNSNLFISCPTIQSTNTQS